MPRTSEESLQKCPPNLRRLLALHNNSFTHAAKAIKGDRSQLAKLARGKVTMTEEMAERIDIAVAKKNGVGAGVKRANVADAKSDTAPRLRGRPAGKGKESKVVPTDPLLKELIDKCGGWNQSSKALGYSGGYVKKWHEEPQRFTDENRQRVRDFLDGKPIGPPKLLREPRHTKNKHLNKGELGIAIVSVEQSDLEKIMDVAQPMGGFSVFQKRMSPTTWLLIYRFADPEDMFAFKAWAERKCEVITP